LSKQSSGLKFHILNKARAFKTISEEICTEFLKAMLGYDIGKKEEFEKELKKLEEEKLEKMEQTKKLTYYLPKDERG